jgi:hypothetical protein
MPLSVRQLYKKTAKKADGLKRRLKLFLRNVVKTSKKKKATLVKSFRRLKTRVNRKLHNISDIW